MKQQPNPQAAACGSDCTQGAFSSMLGIPMHINGKGPYLVSVDTGAGLTVVLPEVAKDLGLEKVGEEARRGVGGEITLDLVEVDRVSAGGIEIDLDTIGVGSFLKRLCGKSFQGNLGYDILQHGRLTADFAGERMVFHAGNGTPIEGIRFEIASAKKPLVVVETTVNGEGPYRFAVDTGAMGTCIAPQLAAVVGARKGQAIQAAGVGGMVDAYFTAGDLRFRIGDQYEAEVTPVVIDIFGSVSPGEGLNLSGIIGQDILRQYIVTFDYPNQRIRFA